MLIVEDSKAVRKAISQFLQDAGYRTLEAEGGQQGIESFRAEHPDLVITDIMMPEVDGHEVVKVVTQESPDTPIIVASGSDNISDVVKAINLGTWDYIIKPINDFHVLLHTVHRCEEKRRLIEENYRYQNHLEEVIDERTTELKQSLKEKDQLLKEIHHRVKNNLQIIISLLNLQMGIETNTLCIGPLEKMKDRIGSMALVHELLYRSSSFSRIPFDSYILELIEAIKDSLLPIDRNIVLKTDLDEIYFPIEMAVPCGLIINELVGNSLIHAFPESREGSVFISLKRHKNRLHLLISDDGVGMPSEGYREGSGETLGYVLVSTLTSQLHGKMTISSEHGTQTSISFPSPPSLEKQPHG